MVETGQWIEWDGERECAESVSVCFGESVVWNGMGVVWRGGRAAAPQAAQAAPQAPRKYLAQ